jgi:hypothetical protein
MSCLKPISTLFVALLLAGAAVKPDVCQAKSINGELVVVPVNKLPSEARQPGQAMDLRLVGPDTLFLYVEQDNGRNVAVFDVTDPHRIRFKRLVLINSSAPFDFVQPAGQSTELIRYRDGSGTALLDLRKPREPRLKAIHAPASESYILPVEDNPSANNLTAPHATHDYHVIVPSSSQPVLTVKGVVQQLTDEANGAMYLLGNDGLTVIRDLRTERNLAATAPVWRNTIDDN